MPACDPVIFRPSALPKLAACLHYEPDGKTSEAAARGTRIDGIFRNLLSDPEAFSGDHSAETSLARAGVGMLRDRVGDKAPILSKEEDCKIRVQDSEFVEVCEGTCDAIVPSLKLSADLKTGGIRDYTLQMAAYALGCMDRFGCDEWTTIILYVDQGEITEIHWTYEEAAARVLGLRDAWMLRSEVAPTPCEYCEWCRRGPRSEATCPAVTVQLAPVSGLLPLPANLEEAKTILLSDPARAGAFKRALKIVSALEEAIDAKAKEGGGWCPEGFKVQRRKGRLQVKKSHLDAIACRLGTAKVFECCTINAAKLRAVIEEHSEEAASMFADAFEDGPSTTALVEVRR